MIKIRFVSIIIISFIFNLTMFGQEQKLPKWIEGSWYNSAESNTFNLVFLTFKNDSIFIGKGFSGLEKNNQISLNERYSDYKITNYLQANVFRTKFEKNNEIVEYEFKLQNVKYSKQPVLTYSLSVNGNLKRKHSTSCNFVFEKINKGSFSN